ncbi:MAG: transcription antitermination factor NusB [Prevotella sp.]
MINRELIRVKIVQLTYAYYQNGNNNIDAAEKELVFSLSKAYDLYNYMLSLMVAITKEAREYYNVMDRRARREGLECPSSKFADNRFALQLENNRMLCEFMESKKMSWEMHMDFVKRLYQRIREAQFYQDYIDNPVDSYETDREVWRKIYKAFIRDNEELDEMLEDESLYWNDDKDIVDTFVIKTIKRFEEKNGVKQPLLSEYDSEDDRDFARKLFRASILKSDEFQRYMNEASWNWDFGRLAYMDVVIMQIAIAEMMTFPNIPVSVTINEFVELAKLYSTPRSGSYVNGMLDAIARNLSERGLMLKNLPDKDMSSDEGSI